MHLSPRVAAVRSKAVVLLLLTFCLLLLPLWVSVIVLCFVVLCFVSILVLQSSRWGKEGWLLCLICLPCVSWLFSGFSSRCHRVVCGLWLWYFLIILAYYFFSIFFKKKKKRLTVQNLSAKFCQRQKLADEKCLWKDMSIYSDTYSIYRRVHTCYCSDCIGRDQLKTQVFSAACNLVFYQ